MDEARSKEINAKARRGNLKKGTEENDVVLTREFST